MAKRLTEKQRFRRDERKRKKREKKQSEVNANKLKDKLYAEWSKSVKERDNYTCQICKKKFTSPKAINAAHIFSKENYPQLMHDINNGITLCYYDHKNSKTSSHLDGFAFTIFLMKEKPDQYRYLKDFLEYYGQ